jgi:hypothetical protein
MRDLISAFSGAVKARLVRAGWKKRTGTSSPWTSVTGFSAWLGLNSATKWHPLQIHPVPGVRHDESLPRSRYRRCQARGQGIRAARAA